MALDYNKFKIIDDYLPEDQYIQLRDYFLGPECYWYFCGNYGGGYPQMEHVFHNELVGPQRYAHTNTVIDATNVLAPILETFNYACLVRIRAILNWRTDTSTMTQRDWHVDVPFDCTTAIYYLHDSDGCTLFEDGDNEPFQVETKANRLVEFPSQYRHTTTPFTQPDRRVLINFNFIRPVVSRKEGIFASHSLICNQHPMQ